MAFSCKAFRHHDKAQTYDYRHTLWKRLLLMHFQCFVGFLLVTTTFVGMAFKREPNFSRDQKNAVDFI